MLLILRAEDKVREKENIDSIVWAEIPDPTKYPRLHQCVKKHMTHVPCGTLNVKSPCMQDGICSKDYPKPFSPETIEAVEGYPRYRRRDNGISIQIA